MEGVYINQPGTQNLQTHTENTSLMLLAKRQDVEIMVQTLQTHATVWVTPAQERDTLEFFYILSGALHLYLDGGDAVQLRSGSSFYVEGLAADLHISVLEEAKLLYVTNRPMFDYIFGYQGDLNELLMQIDKKDNYTCRHCCNVMEYSVQLLRRLSPADQKSYDLATAALFHDVGKCFIPDEILLKPGKLTPAEFRRVMKHPLDGARMLEQKFSKRIAEIARSHHERLDGSGYPFGLSGDEISLEERIIAVADAFDAMTTQRPYNVQKTYEEAAHELLSLPAQFDSRICALLLQLVQEGTIPLQNPSDRSYLYEAHRKV